MPGRRKMPGTVVWKFPIYLILLCLLIRAEASILNDCRRETGASWESLRKLSTGDFDTDDLRVKCYVKCYMSKIGILNESGVVDFDVVRRLTPEYRELIANYGDCTLATGKDVCDRAFEIVKCIASRRKMLDDVDLPRL